MKIKSVKALEILDSRGNPTVETFTSLEDSSVGWAAVPSGASTGKYEAVELRDGDKNRYLGAGVLKAVENVNQKISRVIRGLDAGNQEKLDRTMIELDGTENKANLGANAILSVSLSAARAQAVSEKKELYQYLTKFNPKFSGRYLMPIPEMNVMNGGKHANWATDIQEYMLFPIGAKTIAEAIRMNAEVYQLLKKIIKAKGYAISVGDEGGFAPNVGSNEEPFQLLSEAIKKSGYMLGKGISFGIDSAATEFYKDGKYKLNKEGKTVTSDGLAAFYIKLAAKYPIISMEDIFAEDDWDAFQKFTRSEGKKIQILGDDLYVTNRKRLQRGIEEKTTNSILIKLNQIGTLTETIETIL
ncbi:phosphopyruvate hydratase, partial [Candidatus Microgenomates bacterium]|nr:phosphopyruvate hydratase [Candidatus Microgenomates bacterium]